MYIRGAPLLVDGFHPIPVPLLPWMDQFKRTATTPSLDKNRDCWTERPRKRTFVLHSPNLWRESWHSMTHTVFASDVRRSI